MNREQAMLKKFAKILRKSFDPLDWLFHEASTDDFVHIKVQINNKSYDCFEAPLVRKRLNEIRERIRSAVAKLNKAYALIANEDKDGIYL